MTRQATPTPMAAIYAWVPTAAQHGDLGRQIKRLSEHCAARDWPVVRVVTEISAGYGDSRLLVSLLNDRSIQLIVVERPLVAVTYIRVLLARQRRRLEIVEADGEAAAAEIDLDYTFPGCRYRGGRSTLP